jgi:LTXXQ motif family protein
MLRLTYRVARAASLATLLGAIAFASPLFASSSDLSGAITSRPAWPHSFTARTVVAQASSPEAASPAAAPESAKGYEAPVEAHIKQLHKRLHITAAQEPQWNALTEVMRDNAKAMKDLEKQRAQEVKTLNAVDVVKSYGSVIEAHEEGMKKFIPAFEALYNSLSDAQKKIADAMFRGRAEAAAAKEVKENK